MVLPTKHENLQVNLLVLGAEIIRLLKQEKEPTIEDVFQHLKRKKDLTLERLYDALLMLWLCDFVELEDGSVKIRRDHNVSN